MPIIVSEHGDINVFDSREEAEAYLEPHDVENAEYEIFDNEGIQLLAQVEETPGRGIPGLAGIKLKVVRIRDTSMVSADRLRALLSKFVERSGHGPVAESLPIPELIRMARTLA